MAQRPDGHWYTVKRDGLIEHFTEDFTPLGIALDITDIVETTWFGNPAEFGALSIAMDPDFENRPYVYLYYVGNPGLAEARLARFTLRPDGTADKNSEVTILRLPLYASAHVGGTLNFGPDGLLYLSVGDNTFSMRAQDPFSLYGKLLRLDVRGALPYQIPGNNPHAGGEDGAPEVFALGLRNPFRWRFDSQTGDIWLGDVGASAYEEVNVIESGGNYGWPIREGAHCAQTPDCSVAGLTDPVYEFAHVDGANSVIGGFVYHGDLLPALRGKYLFSNLYADGFALVTGVQGEFVAESILEFSGFFTIAEGRDREVYIARSGGIFRYVPAAADPVDTFPGLLSETGCFDPQNPLIEDDALIPYQVRAPLWSDGATKQRFFSLPDGGKITIEDEDDWDFPVGSVLVKHFDVDGLRVETRLFMRHADGRWGGYSYEWDDALSDAILLDGAKTRVVGDQVWRYPSRAECFQCHTQAAGESLGLETAQQNFDIVDPKTKQSVNQLALLEARNVFDTDPGDPAQLPALADPAGNARVDARARAYVHANCSGCHRPGGTGQGSADFRYSVDGSQMGILNALPVGGDLGVQGATLFAPGQPEMSIMSLRMHSLGTERMPPLGSSVVDVPGAQLIDQWIESGLGFDFPDSDSDHIADFLDNCTLVGNGPALPDAGGNSQLDGDGDGYGNLCDADINNDGIVNVADLGVFRKRMFSADPAADLDGSGTVNILDIGVMRSLFFLPPGPSGVASGN
ncbi:MAG: PQQ-dependent sugar dehydrogenase [Gammaproteobacteria bacterium]